MENIKTSLKTFIRYFRTSANPVILDCHRTALVHNFCQQLAVLRETFTPPALPPKKQHQTFVLHTQNSMSFVLRTQKKRPKKAAKGDKKGGKKSFS